MSDTGSDKPQGVKPSRLSGLVAPKGTAARPSEPVLPQALPGAAPQQQAPITPPPPAGTGSKSLTLRLPDAEYERLRARAYATRMTHQGILAEALRRYLDEAESA